MKKITLFLSFFFLVFTVYGQIQSEKMIGYWPFNGNALDESGAANDGTVYDAELTTDRFGNFNSAYSFNGSTAYIDCGNKTILNEDFDTFSISFWFLMYEGGESEQHMIGKWNNTVPEDHYGLRLINKRLHWFLANEDQSSHYFNATTTLFEEEVWYHIAVVWDKSTTHKVYVNGEIDTEFKISYVDRMNTTSDVTLKFGRQIDPSYHNRPFYGKLDDIRFYAKGFTEKELKYLLYESPCIERKVIYESKYDDNAADGIETKPILSDEVLSVYPNPSNDVLWIECFDYDNFRDFQLYLINENGALVWQDQLIQNLFTIDVKSFAKGSYILQVLNKNNEIIGVKKVVVK